jgi:type I restriction enzyme S subunit
MIPKLRFAEFTAEWSPTFLGDVASVTKLAGFEFTKHIQYSEEGKIIAIRGLNVKGLKLDLSDVKFIDNSDFSMLGRSKLYKGDIIFTYVGTIGNTAHIPENDRFYLAPNVALVRMESASNTFMVQLLHSDIYYKKEIIKHITSSSQPALSMQSIRKFNVVIPSINEQLKIAHLLSTVDKKINLLTKKKEALETYKKGLMQKIFSQELRFKREDGTDYPEWRLTKFVEVCLKENSGLSKGDLSDVGLNEVYGAAGNLEGFTNIPSPSSAYVSIIKDGAGVGRVKFLPPNTSTIGTLDMIVAYDELVLPYFLYILLINIRWRKYTVGSTIPHIYFRDWKTEKVQIPSLEEQRKIVKVFSDLESKCSKILQKIERTEQLKKGLLQQMFV